MDTNAQTARRRVSWRLWPLTVIVVPVWAFAIFTGVYLIQIGLSPANWPPATAIGYVFNMVSATVVVLMLPALGLFWTWYGFGRGRAAGRRGMMRAGVALLSVWLVALAAFFAVSEIAAGGRENPGSWADPYFIIPPADRETYRLSRHDRQLSVIVPHAGDLDPQLRAGAQVPLIAIAEIGRADLSGIAMTDEAICDGALRGMVVNAAARGHANSERLRGLLAGNPKAYRLWISAGRDWAAMCDPSQARCEAIFVNAGWVADFPLEREALCRAPAMNTRFAALVERWRRK
jgi:hypothetical protein